MKRSLMVATCFCIGVLLKTATGCAAAQKPVEDLSTFVSVSEPILRGAYEAEQRACIGLSDEATCISTVRAKWAPVRQVLEDIEQFWCAAKPEACQ